VQGGGIISGSFVTLWSTLADGECKAHRTNGLQRCCFRFIAPVAPGVGGAPWPPGAPPTPSPERVLGQVRVSKRETPEQGPPYPSAAYPAAPGNVSKVPERRAPCPLAHL
jgi:hypothetical protein